MPIKETSDKKCPFCGSNHVNDGDIPGFAHYSQPWTEEENQPSPFPLYQCRNCATRFYFTGY